MSTIPRLLPIARPMTCCQESKRIACAVILVDCSGTTYDRLYIPAVKRKLPREGQKHTDISTAV